ncbi:putative methyltransferase NSUN7 [Gastrophryne carolinensis]
MTKVVGTRVPTCPALMLLHHTNSSVAEYRKSALRHMINAARVLIPRLWKTKQAPTVKDWILEVDKIKEMEELTAAVQDKEEETRMVWTSCLYFVTCEFPSIVTSKYERLPLKCLVLKMLNIHHSQDGTNPTSKEQMLDDSPGVRSSSWLIEKRNYSDQIYINAARIFQGIHLKKPPDRKLVSYGNDSGLPLPVFKDERTQHWSYELAFNALKYQDLLETILLISGFYQSQPLPDEVTSLLVVMLYDFQDRKFQPRYISNKDEVIEVVREIETSLNSFRTKLAAAIAKCRIKYAAPTIEYILPETVRKQEQRASTVPLYAWINIASISTTEVFNTLKAEGFSNADSPLDLDGYMYCVDKHCQDLLVFPPHLKEKLTDLKLFRDYKLIIQDRTHALAAQSVKVLHNMDGDIIVGNPCSGFTIAHLSILTHHCACSVYVCGVKSESRDEELEALFTNMGCKNIKLLKESFTDLDPSDVRLQKAKLILLLPQCSGSGVSNPVEYILNEHGDTSLLQDLSQGSVSADRLNALVKQQVSELNHAMKFSKVQTIVYCTCSVYQEENENVVNQALHFMMEGTKGQPYKLGPPAFPFYSPTETEQTSQKFIKIEPSEICNGCFLAVLTREKDVLESISPQDVLARAALKGLLNGIGTPKSPRKDEKKKKAKTNIHKTAQSASKINDFLNRENTMSPKAQSPRYDQLSFLMSTNYSKTPQIRKPPKPGDMATMSPRVKNPNSFCLPFRDLNRQARPKPEEKIVLKPVQIILPPVSVPFPYSSSPSVKIRSPVHYYHQRWHSGVRNSPQNAFIPALCVVSKSKDSVPITAVRHPKPWH